MTQTKEKWDSLVLSRTDFCMVGRCHGIPCLHFLFRSNGKKEHLDENDFRHSYGNYFRGAVVKVLDFNYVQSSFSTITRHIDNGI